METGMRDAHPGGCGRAQRLAVAHEHEDMLMSLPPLQSACSSTGLVEVCEPALPEPALPEPSRWKQGCEMRIHSTP